MHEQFSKAHSTGYDTTAAAATAEDHHANTGTTAAPSSRPASQKQPSKQQQQQPSAQGLSRGRKRVIRQALLRVLNMTAECFAAWSNGESVTTTAASGSNPTAIWPADAPANKRATSSSSPYQSAATSPTTASQNHTPNFSFITSSNTHSGSSATGAHNAPPLPPRPPLAPSPSNNRGSYTPGADRERERGGSRSGTIGGGTGVGSGTVDRAVGGRALRTMVAVLPLKVLLQVLRQCSDITLAEYDAAFRKKGTTGTAAGATAAAVAAATAAIATSSGTSGSVKKGDAVIVATIGGAEAASNSKAAKIREALATAANRLDRRTAGGSTAATTGHTSPTDPHHTATGSSSDQQRTEPTTPTRQSTVAQSASSSNSGVKLDKFKNVVAAAAAAQHSRRRDPQSGLLCL
eukprot:8556-Heterococcus_DN1.PRE.3